VKRKYKVRNEMQLIAMRNKERQRRICGHKRRQLENSTYYGRHCHLHFDDS